MAKKDGRYRDALDEIGRRNPPTADDVYGNEPLGITLPSRQSKTTQQEDPEGAIIPAEEPGVYRYGDFLLTPKGIDPAHIGAKEDWQRLGETLATLNQSIQWLVGDWLNIGETVYGESYDQAAEDLDRETKTVYNWASIAKSVEFSRRRENLTFSHHGEVAHLNAEQQDYWLDQAIVNQWSVAALRNNIKKVIDGINREALDVIDRIVQTSLQSQRKLSKEAKKALNAGPAQRQQAADILEQHIVELEKLRDALRG